MLYVDLPTRQEFQNLRHVRNDACVSIYLKTTPLSQDAGSGRIEIANLFKTATEQLEANGFDKRRLASLSEHIDDIREDEEFWRMQANSLVILATPDSIKTYRLANGLAPNVMVSDRFHLNPLMRALTFPNAAYVLQISENLVRLIEASPNLEPADVRLSDLPNGAADALRKTTLNDRAPSGRIQGTEGQNVRLIQYARKVDAILRRSLTGRDTPLILAAADRMAAIYRSINHYPNLVDEHIAHATDRTTNEELALTARAILDRLNAAKVLDIRQRYEARANDDLAISDLSDAARAATFGAIDTLLVDFDADLPGTIDEQTGVLSLASKATPSTYDVVDEIAARTLATGGHVLSVRASDMPTASPAAAILRYRV